MAAPSTDGGAVLDPLRPLEPYPVTSTAPSSEREIRSSSKLFSYIDTVAPIMTPEEWARREGILQELLGVFRRWVARVATQRGRYADEEAAAEAGGSLYVSGSYKLHVSDMGSDIDTICIAPDMVTRNDFFDSLPDFLSKEMGVTSINPIRMATVPIIEIEVAGVSIDLQFVSLPLATIPRFINILDDKILEGLDLTSVRTLNGPRVNYLIHRLVPNFDTFKLVVRVLRLWGKMRGLHGNKSGFFGGINYAILAAFICQMYPNRCAAGCVLQFFQTMKDWQWPRPIYINRPYTTPMNYEIWDAEHNPMHRSDVMPILTPAYPCMNSLQKATKSTLSVMMVEFLRGYEICQRILENPDPSEHDWSALFAPTEFFLRFDRYLVFDITAGTEAELKKWQGWVGSRFRSLLLMMENEHLPFKTIFPFPAEKAHAPWKKRVPEPASAGQIAASCEKEADHSHAGPAPPPAAEQQPAELPADVRAPPMPDAAPVVAGWGITTEKLDISEATGGATTQEDVSTSPLAPGEASPASPAPTTTAPADQAADVLPSPESSAEGQRDAAPQSPEKSAAPTSTTVVSWFIGILLDTEKLKSPTVNVSGIIRRFLYDRRGVISYADKTESMKISQEVYSWETLPDEIFPAGRQAAAEMRVQAREWFDAHTFVTPYNVFKVNRAGNTFVAAASSTAAAANPPVGSHSGAPKMLTGIPGLRASTRTVYLRPLVALAMQDVAGQKRPFPAADGLRREEDSGIYAKRARLEGGQAPLPLDGAPLASIKPAPFAPRPAAPPPRGPLGPAARPPATATLSAAPRAKVVLKQA